MGKWDKGIDYMFAYNKILKHMARAKPPALCYDAILLIQLRNGSRVSEAVRAFLEFLNTKSLELEVRVSKKRNKNIMRLMVIPQELIKLNIVSQCFGLRNVEEKKLINRVKNYCIYTYEYGSHNHRYAFINEALRRGIDALTIAEITKQSKADIILRYVQKKRAEETLKDFS
ncbi:MAG: hypothetical protein JHC26_00840 [Thermofilum sp.]|jgi:hypothetical protein|uniref:hypothetical protein n=1 Tax=Thermofilum sp. TaxID=1961369 RepID=UPI002589BD6B|nr:hypothetical protein [Thermofilum sp.]MCI4407611.1 hypothetical protein [Thermofilum sp.]